MTIHRDRTGRAHFAHRCGVFAAAAFLAAIVGGAQDAAAQPVRPFQVRDFGGFLEAGFFADLEERSRSESQSSNFDRIEFSQLLNLSLDSYIYHPRFLTFQGGFRFESIEGIADNAGTRFLYGADWRLNFLQEYRDSLSIYGRFQQNEVSRAFTESYELTSQLYGAALYHTWGWLPFDLTYQHRSTQYSTDNRLDEVTDEVLFRGDYVLGERSRGGLNYNLVFRDIRGNDTRRQAVNLSNSSEFGDESEKRWSTYASFEERADSGQMYAFTGNSNFSWQHTEDLSSRYRFNGHWEKNDDQSLTSLNPNIIIRHQLYESLTNELDVFGRFEDASFASTKEFGTQLSSQYVKELSDFGRLAIRVAPRVVMTYTRPEQETASVTDEAQTLVGLLPSLLQRQDIIASSIVVTDLAETIEYVPGPGGDYMILQTGGGFETELVRTAFSAIADGETVLVDYTYRLTGDSDILTTGVSTSINLWFFQHVGLFGRYSVTDQDILSGDRSDLRTNSYEHEVAGFELTWPWFNLKAQYENYAATLGPFEGFSTSLALFTYGRLEWHARANAGYSLRDQKESGGETITRADVGLGGQRRLFRRGFLEIDGIYVRERWSGESSFANDLDSFALKCAYTWWYGKVQVKLESRVARVLREAEDRSVYQINLRVRRDF
jgi:hypothetical protein